MRLLRQALFPVDRQLLAALALAAKFGDATKGQKIHDYPHLNVPDKRVQIARLSGVELRQWLGWSGENMVNNLLSTR
jgi:hypothetical protein